ncbi:porin [Burkholderia sp. Ac-20379]|uniref:porin n=1 Tax=Burkholderia sp. Ac-20379 TaxID=2703900 RepID=UPI001981B9B4|nr:porin [Burkholderia sp. Ac-20379]MBN3727394.1 porin [Burkholderia sp. Ac-20379]
MRHDFVARASLRATPAGRPVRFPLRPCVRALAFAALCAPAAQAFAQGSVTLYGVIDTSIEVTNPGSGWVPRLDSGAYRGSRIGLRGSEPIGGGVRILFDIESGFGSNDGTLATAGTLFNRQAWVGVGSRWGELRVGRQYSPIYIPFKGQIDAFGAGTIASGLNNLSKITPYESNAITYLSPDFHGFTSTVMVSMRDPSAGGANGLGGTIATFAYKQGPFRIAFAHQQTNDSGALRANMGGVSYTVGKFTGFVSMFNGDGGTPRYHDDGAAVSVRYAVSSRWRAALGYAYMRDRSGKGNDADQFSAMTEYDLSPRVLLYASAGWLRNRGTGTFTLRGVNVTGLTPAYPGATVKGVQVGMIQRF